MARVKSEDLQYHPLVRPSERGGLTPEKAELALQVCEKIASGELMRDFLAPGERGALPTETTFRKWVILYPEVARAFNAAVQISAFALEEEAIDTGRKVKRSPGTPQNVSAHRTAIQALQWSAERRNPAIFSAKAPVNLTVPIQINTGLDFGQPGVLKQSTENVYRLEAKVPADVGESVAEEVEQIGMVSAADAVDAADDPRRLASLKKNPAFGPQKRVLLPVLNLDGTPNHDNIRARKEAESRRKSAQWEAWRVRRERREEGLEPDEE